MRYFLILPAKRCLRNSFESFRLNRAVTGDAFSVGSIFDVLQGFPHIPQRLRYNFGFFDAYPGILFQGGPVTVVPDVDVAAARASSSKPARIETSSRSLFSSFSFKCWISSSATCITFRSFYVNALPGETITSLRSAARTVLRS
ncbi:MAG: hypothetical protein QOJ99_3275 [Bryobacterales bacterium]|nr:hypothetical protein [Bryobacterales bacterium]